MLSAMMSPHFQVIPALACRRGARDIQQIARRSRRLRFERDTAATAVASQPRQRVIYSTVVMMERLRDE